MVLFVIFVSTIAYVISRAMGYGISFTLVALIISIISSVGSYYFSDQVVLSTTGAVPIKKSDNPQLYRIVENLAIGDGIPMPKIYIIKDLSPNAFATGRDPDHASIAVTSGILDKLNKNELEGVIAHELSHIKNFDIRLMAISAVLVGFIAIIADLFMRGLIWGNIRNENENRRGQGIFIILGLVFAIIAPLVALLIQLAISRKREFLADASGTLLTRYPEGLARALEKISSDPRPLHGATSATAHLFIVNPFKGKGFQGWFAGLFNTHPPIEERIKILRSM
ncbi:M48 family metallopeptidase [Patescibacteria group bacterium]|nr:M48 family metallopeptidase [Patescibacteria group bacterium]